MTLVVKTRKADFYLLHGMDDVIGGLESSHEV